MEKEEKKEGERLKIFEFYAGNLLFVSSDVRLLLLPEKGERFCALLSFFLSIYFVYVTHLTYHTKSGAQIHIFSIITSSHTTHTHLISFPLLILLLYYAPSFLLRLYLPSTMNLFRKSLAALLGCALLATTTLVADAGLVSQVAVLTFAG